MAHGAPASLSAKSGQRARSTHIQTEVGGVRQQFDRTRIKIGQPHADGSHQQRREFVAQNGHDDIERLHAAEQSGVFEYMVIRSRFHEKN